MRAMVLERQREPLVLRDLPIPTPQPGQLLIKVECCAVCRTDLHVVDGELPDPNLPLIARADGREVLAFTRDGDKAAQELARSLGAVWAGGSGERQPLDAAIIF